MDGEEPGGEEVEEVVQAVGVSDTVDGGVEGGKEGQDIRYEACSVWKLSVGILFKEKPGKLVKIDSACCYSKPHLHAPKDTA